MKYNYTISERFKKQHKLREKIAKMVFIVTAPRMLKYDERDYEIGIPGKIVNGRPAIANDEELDVFGMDIVSIAKAAKDGFRISLYNKSDFDILWDMLKEFLSARDDRINSINISNADDDKYELLDEFAKEIMKLNKAQFRQKGLVFDKVKKSLGIISADEINEKIAKKRREKSVTDEVAGVYYPKPRVKF